ncbi:hypothetical protein B0T16DRAFT_415536 [Cercophora newfieldiana]|uniref:Uncharacterized protein n=1 Tax=Cercophora newfieldiana TaxID=92897 RepID=A0AA40CMV9_9PEZI|nr:hypothetical protein B0T16DRAFT_415536 [Cercophora newfieldiana]
MRGIRQLPLFGASGYVLANSVAQQVTFQTTVGTASFHHWPLSSHFHLAQGSMSDSDHVGYLVERPHNMGGTDFSSPTRMTFPTP